MCLGRPGGGFMYIIPFHVPDNPILEVLLLVHFIVWKRKLREVKTRFIGLGKLEIQGCRLPPRAHSSPRLPGCCELTNGTISQWLPSWMSIPRPNSQAEVRPIPLSSLLEFGACTELYFSMHFTCEGELSVHMVISQSWAWQGYLGHSSALRQ